MITCEEFATPLGTHINGEETMPTQSPGGEDHQMFHREQSSKQGVLI